MNGPEQNESLEDEGPLLTKEQQRAHLYTMLSFLWIFPSFGALWILGMGIQRWRDAISLAPLLGSVKLEEWLAFGLLAAHAVFIFRARRYRKLSASEPTNLQ